MKLIGMALLLMLWLVLLLIAGVIGVTGRAVGWVGFSMCRAAASILRVIEL